MNQLIAGGAAFVLVLVLWGLGRRPSKTILSSTDAGMVAAINRAQLGLVDSGLDKGAPSPEPIADAADVQQVWQRPSSEAQAIALRKRLLRDSFNQGHPDERLEAIQIAFEWGHRSCVPLLRRGLRDADARIVQLSAAAIERHRAGHIPAAAQPVRPPRNVARMR